MDQADQVDQEDIEATMEGEFVSALEDLTKCFVLGDASLEKAKVAQVGERSLIYNGPKTHRICKTIRILVLRIPLKLE